MPARRANPKAPVSLVTAVAALALGGCVAPMGGYARPAEPLPPRGWVTAGGGTAVAGPLRGDDWRWTGGWGGYTLPVSRATSVGFVVGAVGQVGHEDPLGVAFTREHVEVRSGAGEGPIAFLAEATFGASWGFDKDDWAPPPVWISLPKVGGRVYARALGGGLVLTQLLTTGDWGGSGRRWRAILPGSLAVDVPIGALHVLPEVRWDATLSPRDLGRGLEPSVSVGLSLALSP